MTPRWVDGPPTEPGAYWWCWRDETGRPLNGVMRLTEVYMLPLSGLVCSGAEGPIPVTKPRRLWYGPFSKPETPHDEMEDLVGLA